MTDQRTGQRKPLMRRVFFCRVGSEYRGDRDEAWKYCLGKAGRCAEICREYCKVQKKRKECMTVIAIMWMRWMMAIGCFL